MNWKTALERYDSIPEEQPRGRAGCDMDHFISLNRLPRIGPMDKSAKRDHNSVHTDRRMS